MISNDLIEELRKLAADEDPHVVGFRMTQETCDRFHRELKAILGQMPLQKVAQGDAPSEIPGWDWDKVRQRYNAETASLGWAKLAPKEDEARFMRYALPHYQAASQRARGEFLPNHRDRTVTRVQQQAKGMDAHPERLGEDPAAIAERRRVSLPQQPPQVPRPQRNDLDRVSDLASGTATGIKAVGNVAGEMLDAGLDAAKSTVNYLGRGPFTSPSQEFNNNARPIFATAAEKAKNTVETMQEQRAREQAEAAAELADARSHGFKQDSEQAAAWKRLPRGDTSQQLAWAATSESRAKAQAELQALNQEEFAQADAAKAKEVVAPIITPPAAVSASGGSSSGRRGLLRANSPFGFTPDRLRQSDPYSLGQTLGYAGAGGVLGAMGNGLKGGIGTAAGAGLGAHFGNQYGGSLGAGIGALAGGGLGYGLSKMLGKDPQEEEEQRRIGAAAKYRPNLLQRSHAPQLKFSADKKEDHDFQVDMPAHRRHGLDEFDRHDVERGQSQWMPQMFQSPNTPIPMMMSHPGKTGLLAGLAGGAAGGLLGGTIMSKTHPQLGALIGALGLGGATGLITGLQQKATNDGLLEMMHRLPPGSTKRDLTGESDEEPRDLARMATPQTGLSSSSSPSVLGTLGAMARNFA